MEGESSQQTSDNPVGNALGRLRETNPDVAIVLEDVRAKQAGLQSQILELRTALIAKVPADRAESKTEEQH